MIYIIYYVLGAPPPQVEGGVSSYLSYIDIYAS